MFVEYFLFYFEKVTALRFQLRWSVWSFRRIHTFVCFLLVGTDEVSPDSLSSGSLRYFGAEVEHQDGEDLRHAGLLPDRHGRPQQLEADDYSYILKRQVGPVLWHHHYHQTKVHLLLTKVHTWEVSCTYTAGVSVKYFTQGWDQRRSWTFRCRS